MVKRRDRLWMLAIAGSRRMINIPVLGKTLAGPSNRLFARRFIRNLRQLHDVLAETEISGRYWMWAGMLLGWAREGALIAHDRDADFAILPEDLPRLINAMPALRRAGFKPLLECHNNEGNVTELTLRCHLAKFEFFIFEPVDDMLRYFVYGWLPNNLVELEGRIPAQKLVPFEFLGRTWLRHDDFERELTWMYGDWHTPIKDWDYLSDDLAIVSRQVWTNTDTSWTVAD
jgi:hypothetical protein